MELFERGREERLNISAYIISPKSINDIDTIAYHDNYAQRRIKEAEAMIASLQSYRLMLCGRAQEIAAAPWHLELELKREYHYYRKAVTYQLTLYRVYDADGIEPQEIERRNYTGKERHKALADYAAELKARPGIIARKEIEKGPWER